MKNYFYSFQVFTRSRESPKGNKAKGSNDALYVWGQTVLIKYNYKDVLTLKLSRKSMSFLSKDKYFILGGDELGELLIHHEQPYKFKQTQLFHYRNLVNLLEVFLRTCGISFVPLDFQADHFLENPFIKNIDSIASLEIINNTGFDLVAKSRDLLQNFLRYLGVSSVTFYADGKTLSTYQQLNVDGDDAKCWEIQEVIPWVDVALDKGKNYLVLNRELESEAGSMAYRREDGLWSPAADMQGESSVDFCSLRKRKLKFIDTGEFFSTQGINLSNFQAVKKSSKRANSDTASFLIYDHAQMKIDKDKLYQEAAPFTGGQYLENEDLIIAYLSGQNNVEQIGFFKERHNIKLSPEFQKVLIELGIKNWIKESIGDTKIGLPVALQSFSEQKFFAKASQSYQ
ncbi:MAG: hypothetical protein IPQ04_11950 [Saprospiraceae bacterium]|nr:hypothetical protein [Saprospiraceae bacterium]